MSFSLQNFLICLRSGVLYIPATLKMAVIVYVFSVLLGLAAATIRFYRVPVLSQCFSVFITVYLGVPVMLAINIYYMIFTTFYNDVAAFLHLSTTIRDANFASVMYFTLILGTTCIVSDTFRGAFNAIEPVQFEAGYAIGMTKVKTLVRIILPQVFTVVLPSMVNWFVGCLKNMSIVYIVGIYDIMNGALLPCNDTYSYAEGYVAAALIYWALVVVVERLGKLIEKRITVYKRATV